MPRDDNARITTAPARRLLMTGLMVGTCLAPTMVLAQAPQDPAALEKQKQKQPQGKPAEPRKAAPTDSKGPPPRPQAAPTHDRPPPGVPPQRGAPPQELRRANTPPPPAHLPPPAARQVPPPAREQAAPIPPPQQQPTGRQAPRLPRSDQAAPGTPPVPPSAKPPAPTAPKSQAAPATTRLPPPAKSTATPAPGQPAPLTVAPEAQRLPGSPGKAPAAHTKQPPGGSPAGAATTRLKAPDGTRTAPGTAPLAPSTPSRTAAPAATPKTLDQVRSGRVSTVAPTGQTVIQEPGNRTIVKQGNQTFVTRNETTVIQNFAPNARTSRRADGVSETVFARPDGTRVFTEVDGSGRLLRRYRRDPGGREIVLMDNRRFLRNVAIGAGVALVAAAVIVSLPRPVHSLPREKYIVEYVHASDDDIYEALTAPPIERLERTYSLDEIRYSESLRDRVRRVDLDSINFEFGSFEVTPDQYGKLERIARAMLRALTADPTEVYLIEGYTDAVGTEEDNASLSDRRAEAVARVLVEHFSIPIENLVTQGYGEQFLKVNTQAPERANRRVAVRRITPLLSRE